MRSVIATFLPESAREELSSHPLTVGICFFVMAASADVRLTIAGIDGRLEFEGNPLIRHAMSAIGAEGGLWLQKAIVGVLCVLIARFGAAEIKRGAVWIDRIPSTRWAKAWMHGGDRSWIAYVPLYGAAFGQLAAALSWIAYL